MLAELRADQMTVELHGDRIVITPRDRITDQLRERVRYRRHELVEQLTLELRIRAMAARWKYSDDELTEALDGAIADPDGWRRWVDHDELKFGTGTTFTAAAGRLTSTEFTTPMECDT